MGTYLNRIIDAHRAAVSKTFPSDVLVEAAHGAGTPRDFRAALVRPGLSVIAECKRFSPSKGALDPNLDARSLALDYEKGGAAAVSVLTDQQFFGGSLVDMSQARDAVSIPVLRKDFTVAEQDIYEARAHGADAILLIVAALSDAELKRFLALAGELALGALVEVHDHSELERALLGGASIVGVNQRDLATFEVDTERAFSLVESIPKDIVKVAESGISSPSDAQALAAVGYDAVLVGEYLLRSSDRSAAVAALGAEAGIGFCS